MSTKCIAVSNNDVILVAWTFAHKLEACVGCDVRRIPAESANVHNDEPQGESLPAMAGFPGDPNAGKSGRTTAQAPIQKLFWKDLSVTDLALSGPYIYQVIPLKGTFDDKGVPRLIPYPDVRPLFSNPVTLTADHGPAEDAASLQASRVRSHRSPSSRTPPITRPHPQSTASRVSAGQPEGSFRCTTQANIQTLPCPSKHHGGGF